MKPSFPLGRLALRETCQPRLVVGRQCRGSSDSNKLRGNSRNASFKNQQLRSKTTAAAPIPSVSASNTRSRNIDKDVTREEIDHFEATIAADKGRQIRTPWHREGSNRPPVSQPRSAGAMTKGKLLTTPNRLLKLVLPLTTRDHNADRKSVEPLALLVHPQQPLSYLERLIQSELPTFKDEESGQERIPDVNFYAVDALGTESAESNSAAKGREQEDAEDEGISDSQERSRRLRGGPGEGGVETYSGAGRESASTDRDGESAEEEKASEEEPFVKWSKSVELGDFIRDAARGREFAVDISHAPNQIRVGVPSFNDRTYYLRTRLRKKARQISDMATIKKDCDLAAHTSAQRMAYAGFGGMAGWGGIVAWLTFETDLGWDVMEPVTYLVGLAGILGGYGWFLMNRREASYASAMNLTVSRRQNALYESRGFDLPKWQNLIEEGNSLRREIRNIAAEYDVDWDEKQDAADDRVVEALREHRDNGKKKKNDDDEEEGEKD
ncbi:MAG: hypothetical protein M1828_001314 [Chrysothrix sp. TS-e1954]|nr:MAG: hypothetical protein M1828_001314 [Chrysothrix sp. TS-e1954]